MNYWVFFACEHLCCLSGTSGLGYLAGGSLGVATAECVRSSCFIHAPLEAWLVEADWQTLKLPGTGSFLQMECSKTSIICSRADLTAKEPMLSAQGRWSLWVWEAVEGQGFSCFRWLLALVEIRALALLLYFLS